MKIRLESKCRDTHKWKHVANFRFLNDAQAAAELFSKLDECDQRVIDQRWVDDGDETTLFRNGKLVP